MIIKVHSQERIPYTLVSREFHLGYSTVMRWKRRRHNHEVIIGMPGPKKTEPIDLQALATQVKQLDHGIKKTMGTATLYHSHQDQISRRDLQLMVQSVRKIANTPDNHIEWVSPGVVWSIDDTQYRNTKLQQVQDLSSRYKFKIFISRAMTAEKIAKHLDKLFNQYGAPLFLKRDNAGNLNHALVNKVLTDHWVIPFNSPVCYPPYNGGIEKSQYEVKQWLRRHSYPGMTEDLFKSLAEIALHDLNHSPRRVLAGENACEVFFRDKRKNRFDKRQRKEVFEWIKQTAVGLLGQNDRHMKQKQNTAWRMAVKLWLEKNGCVKIEKLQKVSPNFRELLAHN